MNYHDLKFEAANYNTLLLCTDERLNRNVIVSMRDGSKFQWSHAFLMKKEEWLIVFTDHYGQHLFHLDEVDTHLELLNGTTNKEVEEFPSS